MPKFVIFMAEIQNLGEIIPIKERDAKSRAYLFIIERGLFQEFYEFCKKHPAGDYHAECVKGLLNV